MNRRRVVVLTVGAVMTVLAVGAYGLRRAPRRPAASTSGAPSPSTASRPPASGPSVTGATPSGTSKRPVVRAPATAQPAAPSVADTLVNEALAVPPDRVAEAKQLLGDALDADPRHVGALQELSRIRLEDEAYDEALALAERCLEAEPTNAKCADLRLMAMGRSGRRDVEASERAYLERPDDFGRVAGLAQARITAGQLTEARALIDKMRALNPENALVPTLAGLAYLRAGDDRSALAEFEAACRLGQEFACNAAARLQEPPGP